MENHGRLTPPPSPAASDSPDPDRDYRAQGRHTLPAQGNTDTGLRDPRHGNTHPHPTT